MADVTSKVLLGLDADEFRRGIQQVDSKLKETSKLLTNLGQTIGLAFAGAQITDFVKQSLDLAASAQNVQLAFSNIGGTADLMALQAATDGEISKLQLMERAVKAAGQGTSIKELTSQLEYANAVSDATGMAFEEIADKLQTAFAKETTKGLEQVGINVQAMKEQLAAGVPYAEALQAAMQKTIETIGPGMDSAADAVDRQRAAIENLKLQIGTALLPVYESFLAFVAEGLKVISTLLGSQLTLWQKLAYVASYANVSGGAAMRMYLDGVSAANAALQDATIQAPKLGTAINASAEVATGGLKKTNVQAEKFVDHLSGMLALARQFQEQDFNFVGRQEVLANFQFMDMEKVDILEGELVPLIERVNEVRDNMQLAAAVGQQFGAVLSQAFSAAIINGEDFFATLKKALLDYVKQMAVALATTTALAAVFSAVTGGGFGAAFGAISQGTGLGSLFGQGGMLNLNARVSGSDLLLGTARSGTNYGRIGG